MNGFNRRGPQKRSNAATPWFAYLAAGIASAALTVVITDGRFSFPGWGPIATAPQGTDDDPAGARPRQRVDGPRSAARSHAVPGDASPPRLAEALPQGPPRPSSADMRELGGEAERTLPGGADVDVDRGPPRPPHGGDRQRAAMVGGGSREWPRGSLDAPAAPHGAPSQASFYAPSHGPFPASFHAAVPAPPTHAEYPFPPAAPVVFAGAPPFPQWAAEPEEPLPPPPGEYQIPVFRQPPEDTVDIKIAHGRVSLVARNTPLNQIVSLLAQAQGFNVVCAQDISATVSIVLRDVPWHEALTAVLSTAGYTWIQADNIIRVTSVSAGKTLAPDVQGRALQVFPLDYAAGSDVERTVRGLLSPAGQVFLAESSTNNSRKPKDMVVVEDLPEFMERISRYIDSVDRAPRQVLIEAHVLEVKLTDDSAHGVDFKHLFSVLDNNLELQLSGMTTPLPAPPAVPTAFMARVGGGNLTAVVESLQTTRNAKTLASPRVLVVDGQAANIQVGEQLGYKVTTTTETSTMQDVRFLNVGVILNVTPHIARDGRVLMKVKPKVSTGHINPTTEMPEEKTSEVDSQVLLEDGQGIIIGGLIQEKDSTNVQKLPILGDLWLVGALFQRRQFEKHRTEIIVALVPHVQPLDAILSERDYVDLQRCETPLLDDCLTRVPRPWEPAPSVDPLRMPDFFRRGREAAPPDCGEPAPWQSDPISMPGSDVPRVSAQPGPGATGSPSVTRLPPTSNSAR